MQRRLPAPRSTSSARYSLLCISVVTFAVLSLLLSIFHSHFSTQCRAALGVPAKLEANLVEGLFHLKYDADVLRGERDQLLNVTYSNFPVSYTIPNDARAGMGVDKPRLFLFIGVFSDGPSVAKRDAVRDAWLNGAAERVNAVARFVLYGKEKSAEVEAEAAAAGDLLFTDDELPVDKYMVRKTYFLLKYALEAYDVRFVLKAGDDSFVNVPGLVERLKTLCKQPGCRRERMYFGREVRNHEVRGSSGDSELVGGDEEYMRHTSLKKYMPYMMGGGYVVSSDLAQVILGINKQSKDHNLLKLMASEDVTVGFWLMSVELRRVDEEKMLIANQPCCFERITRTPGTPQDIRAWFQSTTDVCRDKWLVLHRVRFVDEMRYLGARLRQCRTLESLKERALHLAAAAANPRSPPVDDGKVVRITGQSAAAQFVLGETAGTPFAATEKLLLAARVPDGQPTVERAELGVFRLPKNNQWTWESFGSTATWNTHVAPRMFWLGISTRYVLFNDAVCAHAPGVPGACGVVYDLQTSRRTRTLSHPVYGVSADGRSAVAVSLARLEFARPGFGEALNDDARDAVQALPYCPDDDGLWVLDVAAGSPRLVVSLMSLFHAVIESEAAGRDSITGLPFLQQKSFPLNVEGACWHWLDKPQLNREASSVVFEYRISNCTRERAGLLGKGQAPSAWRYLFTVDTDGSNLWRLPLQHEGSADYGRNGRLLLCGRSGVREVVNRRSVRTLELPGSGGITGLDSCRYFLDNERFVVMATQPMPVHKLIVWDRWHDALQVIGSFNAAGAKAWGEERLEANPHWSPSGDVVVFDSTHGGQGWQIYCAGVSEAGASMLPRSGRHNGDYPWVTGGHGVPRQIFVDVGAQGGGSLQRFLKSKWDSGGYELHGFEPNPDHLPALERFAKRWGLEGRLVVHPEAAWVADDEVTLSTACTFQPRDLRMTHSGWLLTALARLWNGPPSTIGGSQYLPPAPGGRSERVKAIDFSSWLLRSFDARDQLVLHLDCAGCEFDLLPRMITDGSILLLDEVYIKWYDGIREEYAEWPPLYEELFGVLNIVYTPTA